LKKSKRKYFEQQLSKLTQRQKRILYKRAANLRKAAQVNAKNKRRAGRKEFKSMRSYEEIRNFQKPDRLDNLTIDDWALKVIEEEGLNSIIESDLQLTDQQEYTDSQRGVVVFVEAGGCEVQTDDDNYFCIIGPEIAINQKSAIAVGDNVEFVFARDGTAVVQSVMPRVSRLSRPDPLKPDIERVIAANVDIAVIVASIKRPQIRPSLIDRYMIASERGGIKPVICVNKIDLIDEESRCEELSVLEPYRQLGMDIVETSANNGAGISSLKKILAGRMCVFVGHSGTGKTSILNCILPDIEARVGSVHDTTGLGRHTTTNSCLYTTDCGISVIDTPGIREFGIWKIEPEDLKWFFDEFNEYAEQCKFANCSHTHEPGCRVKEALAEGRITRQRYESYIRILESIQEDGGY
jgi:ribosome biogenesis GTPase / thiamine phosphate phosphatase